MNNLVKFDKVKKRKNNEAISIVKILNFEK
jgi:hypothetical protein